jgi:hypothetical protein
VRLPVKNKILGARHGWFENGIELSLNAIKPLIKKIYPALHEVNALIESLFHPIHALIKAFDFSFHGIEPCINSLPHLLKQSFNIALVKPRCAKDCQHKGDNSYCRRDDGNIRAH